MFEFFRRFRKSAPRGAPPAADPDTATIDACARAYLRRWYPAMTLWGVVSAQERESLRTLIRCLTREQRDDLLAYNSFKANGYVIECNATTSNICSATPFGTRFCAVPVAAHGHFDVFLVQKLWVEQREQEFLRVAAKRPA